MMNIADCSIGTRFTCGGREWQVTDIGTRVVVAIPVIEGWTNGPPYEVAELIFDEEDRRGCEIKGG